MAYNKSISALLVLFLLSFVKSQFNPLLDFILTKDTGATIASFTSNSKTLTATGGGDINSVTDCSSLSLNGESWSLESSFDDLISFMPIWAAGFWVNFETTISTNVFTFGPSSSNHYVVSSTTDGTLKVTYAKVSGGIETIDHDNDVEVTVPLSNFYIDEWTFIVFYFRVSGGSVSLRVLLPNTPEISKASAGGSTAPLTVPAGYLNFGLGVTAKFAQVVVASGASISQDTKTITLTDNIARTLDIAKPCAAGTCSDSTCNKDGYCLASRHYCTTCSGGTCSACDPDTGLDASSYCSSCSSGTSLINNHCNIYLGCDTTKNCAGCSVKSTVCDSCAAGSFLYDESSTSVSCISCANSCISCLPGPECFNCADSIVQDGSTCNVNKIGYQVSADLPNIVLDFAHPLSTGLAKGSFAAKSSSEATILTDTWTLTGCTAGLKQCKIAAPNVVESDLPLSCDFEFTQV